MRDILLIGIVLGSVLQDLHYGKIMNAWIVTAWISGAVYRLYLQGVGGIFYFLIGSLFPIIFLYFLFYFHLLGAGDIKLFSAIGGIIGIENCVDCIVYSFLFGAVYAVLFFILCGNLKQRVSYFLKYFSDYRRTGIRVPYIQPGNKMENIHFTVPILLSILIYIGGFY